MAHNAIQLTDSDQENEVGAETLIFCVPCAQRYVGLPDFQATTFAPVTATGQKCVWCETTMVAAS